MSLNSDPDSKLEQLISRELKKLPDLQAPPALLRNVMARVRTFSAQPWWQRPWIQWPIAARVAISAILIGMVTGLSVMTLPVPTLGSVAARVQEQLSSMTSLFGLCVTLIRAAMLVFTSIPSTAVWAIGVMIAVMYAAFLGFGTVLYRVTYSET